MSALSLKAQLIIYIRGYMMTKPSPMSMTALNTGQIFSAAAFLRR